MKALILFLVLAPQLSLAQGHWRGKVVGVADGDTITVMHNRQPVKIRLSGIDCPEKKQPFGQKAKQATSKLVFGKTVTIKVATIDRYGRTVAEVFVDGRSVNYQLVRGGWAWWYRQYASKATALGRLEQQARQNKRGLWAGPSPEPPWAWRKARKSKGGSARAR